MTHDFHELAIGGVLFAPFAVILLLRTILHLVGFAKLFSHTSIAELSLYVMVLGTIVLLV